MSQRRKLEKAINEMEARSGSASASGDGEGAGLLRERLAALASPGSAGRRRLEVTALSAVVSGAMGQEDLPGLLRDHGGAIAWRAGHHLLAVWGDAGSDRADTERAIRAALALKERAKALGADLRAGVSTGSASLGAPDETHGLDVWGEAADEAALLESAAPQGGILISEGTYRHVRGIFQVTPQRGLAMEGRREWLGVYLLERTKPRAFLMPIRGVGDIETRTVGRDRELRFLQEAYRETVGGCATRVAVVTGQAGVGKSRLLFEFEKWLELLPESILFFQGQARPETARRPHGIFRDLLSFRYEIRDSDSAERVREKFRAGVADCLETARADVVGHWLGFDFSGSEAVRGLLGSQSFRQQAQADVCHLFRSLAVKPVVLFLEDVHWSDDSSLDLLEHIAAEVPDRPILFVCLTRPVLFDRRPGWGAGKETFARLDLAPLTEGQSHDLVDEILQRADAVPEELRRLVVESAQGNPFYTEELILLLMDKGVIHAGEERWSVDVDALARAELPSTLKGILRARLDCLPSRERLMLQAASVVGRDFWDGAVAELSAAEGGPGGASAETLLETARERQLVYAARTSSFEGSQGYSFKHAVLRDIVYESVLQTMKRAFHAGAARWLERNLTDRQTEYLPIIAEHYEAAGDRERAAAFLVRAGEEMVRVSAFKDAVAAFERALHLVPEERTEVLAKLLTNLGDGCRLLGDHATAKRWLQRAVELSRKTGDTGTEVKALNALARTDMIQGAYTEAKPHLAEALRLASRHGHQEGASQVLLNLADVSFRLGDAETATSSGQQSLAIATELGNAQGIAGAHRVLGFATMMKGDYEAAASHHAQGLEMFRSIGDRWGMATCCVNVGEVLRKMGRLDEAVAYWERSLPIFREIGSRHGAAIALLNMGGALAAREGDEARAMENLRRSLEEAMAIGAPPLMLEGLVCVALLYAREGRQPAAARLLGMVMAHPSFNAEIQEYSDPVVKQLTKKMGAETVQSLMDQGRAVDLAAAVREVVQKPA